MNTQDLEQRARELLAAEYEREGVDVTASDLRRGDYLNYPEYRFALAAIVAALRQQPAPVDLEQFREAVACWYDAALPANDVEAERKAEAKRLLSIIDNAVKVTSVPVAQVRRAGRGGFGDALYAGLIPRGPATPEVKEGDLLYLSPQQPAPVVDDAERALRGALEYVGQRADGSLQMLAERAELWMRESKCLLASPPVCVVDAALRADAEQRVSDYLHTIADGGEVRLDPYDPNAIAPIVEAALARVQGGAA